MKFYKTWSAFTGLTLALALTGGCTTDEPAAPDTPAAPATPAGTPAPLTTGEPAPAANAMPPAAAGVRPRRPKRLSQG